MLDKNSKIYVAGHHGLVGSAIWNNLKQRGYENLVGRTHQELDLTDQVASASFLTKNVLMQLCLQQHSWAESWLTHSIVQTLSCRI